MCTLVLLRRPEHPWPLIVAANRDERIDRPWRAPGRWWEDRPDVTAGQDGLAGGSWLGVNDHGVVAAVLNRAGTLGPHPERRSRGELVLEALDHADADQAAQALSGLAAPAYRPFNLVIADSRDAFWLRSDGQRIAVHPIPPGAHMLTALELNDRASPRIATHLDRIATLSPPDPESSDWGDWPALLGTTDGACGHEETTAMCFSRADGYGTVSASLIALPAPGHAPWPVWRFAAGRPDRAPFVPVDLQPGPAGLRR